MSDGALKDWHFLVVVSVGPGAGSLLGVSIFMVTPDRL